MYFACMYLYVSIWERERWFILKSSEAINKGVVNTSNHSDIEPTQQRMRCQKPIPEVFVDVDGPGRRSDERRWVLLKIPRCDIDGVGEGK